MTLSVDLICTDADLAAQVGGVSELNRINKDVTVRDGLRRVALSDALSALASRVPPVFEMDLSAPSELKLAIAYRTLSKLYGTAITAEGDRSHTLAKNYAREYDGAIKGRFSVGYVASAGGTFPFERR